MPPTAIFMPVCVLALWTLVVLGLIPMRRFAAAFGNKVTPAGAAGIHRTRKLQTLNEWLGNVVTADALA